MFGREQLLLLLLVTAIASYGEDVGHSEDESQLKVGRSIDIFTRYGYLSLSLRVVPRNETDWIFREPTINIFEHTEQHAPHPDRKSRNQRRVFDGDFHMEFCDNLKQLVQAYFRDFSFELLDNPWKAFTSSWSTESLAKNLGINSSFVGKDYRYILVRLARFRDGDRLSNPPRGVLEAVRKEIDNIRVGDVTSVIVFIKKFGSHYIHSYVTGNSMYQVFVFNRTSYNQIKARLKNQGISQIGEMELHQYFSPWYADHIGKIKVASGNQTVEAWASAKLRHNYYIFSHPSLLKSKGDTKLLARLNYLLKNEAILEMEMKTLAIAFEDPRKKQWFQEVLDNYIKLWESNL